MSNVLNLSDELSYFVSDDKTLLNIDYVVALIQRQYWGGTRTRSQIIGAIASSTCFGVYEVNGDTVQVGFARVVSDGATFSWLCDVVIEEQHRGKGFGKFLMQSVVAHPTVKNTACYLTSRDAEALYAQFGFEPIKAMRRVPKC